MIRMTKAGRAERAQESNDIHRVPGFLLAQREGYFPGIIRFSAHAMRL